MPAVQKAELVYPLKITKVNIERLKKRSDFLRIARSGKKYICPAFVLQTDVSLDAQTVRFGVTASKKVGNAVKRNLAKRRMRALISLCADDIKQGSDYVLIARVAVLDSDFAQMQIALKKALTRIHGK